jgi:hypothetical protein
MPTNFIQQSVEVSNPNAGLGGSPPINNLMGDYFKKMFSQSTSGPMLLKQGSKLHPSLMMAMNGSVDTNKKGSVLSVMDDNI